MIEFNRFVINDYPQTTEFQLGVHPDLGTYLENAGNRIVLVKDPRTKKELLILEMVGNQLALTKKDDFTMPRYGNCICVIGLIDSGKETHWDPKQRAYMFKNPMEVSVKITYGTGSTNWIRYSIKDTAKIIESGSPWHLKVEAKYPITFFETTKIPVNEGGKEYYRFTPNFPRREFLIGREFNQIHRTNLTISIGYVSRNHCTILPFGDGYGIKDNGSKGGTYVDGERISEIRQLKNGSVIVIGGVPLIFELG